MTGRPRRKRVAVTSALTLALAAGAAAAAVTSVTSTKLTVFTKPVLRATCTLAAPTHDAYVREDVPSAGSNFGSEIALDVEALGTARRFAFLRFDLAGCSLPAGAWVESATLMLSALASPGARTYELRRVTAAWSEAAVTWMDQPATAATASATLTMPAVVPATLEVDVTTDVDAFVTGAAANQGWRVADAGTTVVSALGRFGSREHSEPARRPRLVVVYAH